MKKRLRKKKHRFEFREWGRRLVITRTRQEGFNEFLDSFIMEAIEVHGCRCGGGGKDDGLDVVVELGRASDDQEGKLQIVSAWLDGRSDVAGYRIGELFDLWHDDCPELTNTPDNEHGIPKRSAEASAAVPAEEMLAEIDRVATQVQKELHDSQSEERRFMEGVVQGLSDIGAGHEISLAKVKKRLKRQTKLL